MRILYLLIIVISLKANSALAQGEDEIKASYIFNFIKFVGWPAGIEKETFGLCVVGKGRVIELLSRLDGKLVKNKSIKFMELKEGSEECDLVYFSSREQHFINDYLFNIGKMPILTISDSPDFIELGGIIEITRLGNVVRFKVNLNAAGKAELSLSAKLSELAIKVIK